MRASALALVVFSGALARGAEAPLAALADGSSFRGALHAAEPGGKVEFLEAGKPRVVAVADLAYWGAFVDPGRDAEIVLAGGGIIVADPELRIEGEHLRGLSSLAGSLDLPLEWIAGVMVRPPLDRSAHDQWLARLQAPTAQHDRVLLDNGDELSGTIADWQAAEIKLQTDAGPVNVALARVVAVIFNPSLSNKSRASGLRVVVGLRDGSRLSAIQLAVTPEKSTIKLGGGVELSVPTDAIVALQVTGGNVVYLSDLKPASYRHLPYLQLSWPYQLDRSVLGSPLRASGKVYPKGLGMHSPARITYDLDREYRAFQAELAIDAESGSLGSAVFRVFVDTGDGQWRERFTSEVVRGGQQPVAMSADLTGAKRISLLVDPADRGDELDHADWLNARLSR